MCYFVSFPANKSRRVELSTASLLKVAPTDEERKVVHSLFLNTLDTKYDTNILQVWTVLHESLCHVHHLE